MLVGITEMSPGQPVLLGPESSRGLVLYLTCLQVPRRQGWECSSEAGGNLACLLAWSQFLAPRDQERI